MQGYSMPLKAKIETSPIRGRPTSCMKRIKKHYTFRWVTVKNFRTALCVRRILNHVWSVTQFFSDANLLVLLVSPITTERKRRDKLVFKSRDAPRVFSLLRHISNAAALLLQHRLITSSNVANGWYDDHLRLRHYAYIEALTSTLTK